MSGVILHLRQRINISLNVIVCCRKKIAEAPARYSTPYIDNTFITYSISYEIKTQDISFLLILRERLRKPLYKCMNDV